MHATSREARLDQRQANGVDNIEDVARFSNAIDLSDRGDYANAAIKMAPLVSKYPNSVIVKLTADEISRRATIASKQKATQKVNEKVGGLLRRKWPPA